MAGMFGTVFGARGEILDDMDVTDIVMAGLVPAIHVFVHADT
jgi:hypothetical protein